MIASLSYFQAILLGLLQGVTELFPVSSLGHSVLIPALFGWHNLVSGETSKASFFITFLIGLHFGTALGLLAYYRDQWREMALAALAQVRKARTDGVAALWRLDDPAVDKNYRLLALLVIGAVPVLVIGYVLEAPLRELFAKPLAAAIFLTINGGVLLLAERMRAMRGRRAKRQVVDNLSPIDALKVGSSQILALFAGISRSGVAMVAGMNLGLEHEDAASFAFLLGTPVVFIAALAKMPSLFGHLGQGVRTQSLVGMVVAMVASYVSVSFLAKWFTTKSLRPFGYYCLVAGVLCVLRFA